MTMSPPCPCWHYHTSQKCSYWNTFDFVAPNEASDVFVLKVVAPNDADDVFIDDVDDASFDVSIDFPAPVAVHVIADEAAVEVIIDHNIEPTNSYNLRSRSTPAFDSYSNPNNVNIHQQTQSTEQPYLHHQAKANNWHLPTFDEVQAGYNLTLGELRGMTSQYIVNTQMNAT